MSLREEHLEPIYTKFSRLQWVGTAVVIGFFLGFVDTLFIAAILGYMGLKMPLFFGIPTTFTGYFFTGMLLGSMAPKEIVYEPPIGIVICVIFFMWGLYGFSGHGVFWFIFNFIIIPALGFGICYLGIMLARRKLQNKTAAEMK
jgi:hypothetical protein